MDPTTTNPIPGVICETINLSDNSDSLDESCVIIEQSDGELISGAATVNPVNSVSSGTTVKTERMASSTSGENDSHSDIVQCVSVDESFSIIVLDSPEKAAVGDATNQDDDAVGEPPRKKLLLDIPVVVKAEKEAVSLTPSPAPYNIFSSLLNVTRANSATPPSETPGSVATPCASSSVSLVSVLSIDSPSSSPSAFGTTSGPTETLTEAASVLAGGSTAVAVIDSPLATVASSSPNGPSPASSSSSSRASSKTPALKDANGLSTTTCNLPFCESKCDVETHHPLLRALSVCIGTIASSSSNDEAKDDAAFEAFLAVVCKWEAESTDGWNRTAAINEMAKMKEYYYPLLHTATVSGCVSLVRRMLENGFGDFSQPICSPLMQCLLNIDCAVRKSSERVRLFKEMMELMPSELSHAIMDSGDRPTSLIVVACSRAAKDTSERSFFSSSLKNIIAYVTEHFDVETQRNVFQVRNSEGNTCVHEISRLDKCLPVLRKLHEVCLKLDIVESVFKSTNLRGKTALDLAGEAGAINLVPFLSPIVPSSNKTAPPPVRTPVSEGAREKSATPIAAVATTPTTDSERENGEAGGEGNDRAPSAVSEVSIEAVSGLGEEVPKTVADVLLPTSSHAEDIRDSGKEEEEEMVELPEEVDRSQLPKERARSEEAASSLGSLFRPLFRDDMKTEAKLKIVDKHLVEKRKLAADVKARMEKHGKNIDDIKTMISETEEDTKKKIENMKVIFEVLLRTQQAIGANDAKLKELNSQLVSERKTIAMHEKVSQELTDVTAIMDTLHSTLTHQMTLDCHR